MKNVFPYVFTNNILAVELILAVDLKLLAKLKLKPLVARRTLSRSASCSLTRSLTKLHSVRQYLQSVSLIFSQ